MEANLLLVIFVLLAATVALVPLAKWSGTGTILGYLAAGILIGPYGLRLVSDTALISNVAEFGVVMMLFLIGLEVKPSELWRLRNKVMGLGIPQVVVTGALIAGLFRLSGVNWPTAVMIGLALALSSTAIAMQSIAQRQITRTDTGRASLVVLLVQDMAVIPILAAIPLLAALSTAPAAIVRPDIADAIEAIGNPIDWVTPLLIIAAFAGALLGGRFVVRPLIYFVARAQVREVFTALALALVIGASLLTQMVGLSPALGAFLGGVLLADSEYRHELQSDIEPFKGLLLGLFFISVGMSITFSVFLDAPLTILALLLGFMAIKIMVLYGLALVFRMHRTERMLFALLLSQASEFAFVVLQAGLSAGSLGQHDYEVLGLIVALSMATTPLLLFAFDRLVAPLLGEVVHHIPAEKPNASQKVVVLGYGRFGQIITRLLRSQGFEMTLIDDDPAQIALMRRFGVKVFYGDASRFDLLEAADVGKAQMIVVAVAGGDRILNIVGLLRRHYPDVKIAARAIDRAHAHKLIALGVEIFERETFRSALTLATSALVALGYERERAAFLAGAFADHDTRMLYDSYALRNDEDAYIGFVRQSIDMLGDVLEADLQRKDNAAADSSSNENDTGGDIDNETITGSR